MKISISVISGYLFFFLSLKKYFPLSRSLPTAIAITIYNEHKRYKWCKHIYIYCVYINNYIYNGLIIYIYNPILCLDSALAGPFINLRLSWPSAPKQFQTSGGHVADANGVKGTLIKLIEEAPAFPGQMIHRHTPPLYLQRSSDKNTSGPQPYRHFRGWRCASKFQPPEHGTAVPMRYRVHGKTCQNGLAKGSWWRAPISYFKVNSPAQFFGCENALLQKLHHA